MARKSGWRILMRIEDLDGPRIKAGADRQLITDLEFLGLDWDEEPVYQSKRTEKYRAAIEMLLSRGLADPCVCSRREVESAASAPHGEDGSAVYPGTCRGKYASVEQARHASGRDPAIRFRVPNEDLEFEDRFAGRRAMNMERLGDFVIAKSDGTAAYQLAVVVDDLDQGITEVVRGDDLLESTYRQIVLYRALGAQGRVPKFTHLPLVIGEDSRRLAKRHGDTRISTYHDLGVGRPRILALLARWCGIEPSDSEILNPDDLIDRFDLRRIPAAPVIFTAADDAWLRR
jgi:glutamyl-tRNA synthetase